MPDSSNHDTRLVVAQFSDHATSGCLVRLFWMFGGNLLLLVAANFILNHSGTFFSVADLFYWGLVACLAGARYLDVRRLNGTTATGRPATIAHWRRYAGFLLLVCLLVWGAAHAIAWHAQ